MRRLQVSAPAATGIAILAHAAAATQLLRADEDHVWFLSRRIVWECALRSQLGLPCPTCGVTRSVVMSLHGEFLRAWRVAPVGPVAVAGALAMAFALLALTCIRRQERAARWIRNFGLLYCAVAAAVWLAGWARAFSAALKLN